MGTSPQHGHGDGRARYACRRRVAQTVPVLATGVCPTKGKPNVRADTVRCDQPVVSGIAIDLQDAGEAPQYPFGMNTPATRRIGEGHTRRCPAAPWAIIPRKSPEVSDLGLAGTGVQNRSTGLIHEQLGRALQVGDQCIEDGAQFECCSPTQSASVERSRSTPWRLMI